MKRRGINYDVGIQVNDQYISRPTFEPKVARRELTIIKNDLHCNAVRISGTDLKRLIAAAEIALDLGLEVWLSPQVHDKSADETLAYITECARSAETLRARQPNLIFMVGCEFTWFMQGIMKGETFEERLGNPSNMIRLKFFNGYSRLLNAFLRKATAAARQEFHGAVTYASAPIEKVDWSIFDFVCLDYYRGAKNRDDYGQRLRRHFDHQKPVIISEVGLCAYRGAETKGGQGFMITDTVSGQLTIKPGYVRDEQLQARELVDMLSILDDAGVEGTFVFTFVSPALTHDENPIHDLDLASFSIVKTYADRYGARYPDMRWEPKEAFRALANFYQSK